MTGTSGSGKTTTMHLLKKMLPTNQFSIYDFDQNGVPENVDQDWRMETTAYWLDKAVKNTFQKKITVICGVSVPSEIIKLSKNLPFTIHYGFIKVSDEIISQRLKDRGWDTTLIENNISWSTYLQQDVEKQVNHKIVNSNFSSSEEIAHTFSVWILSTITA